MHTAIYVLLVNPEQRWITKFLLDIHTSSVICIQQNPACFTGTRMGCCIMPVRTQKDINNTKINWLLGKSIWFTPLEGAVVQKVGWKHVKKCLFIRTGAFNGIIISWFPKDRGDSWCSSTSRHQKKAVLSFHRAVPQLRVQTHLIPTLIQQHQLHILQL